MLTWICRNLLRHTDTISVIDYRIRYAGNVPSWLVIFLIILAGVGVFWLYRREAAELAPRYRVTLSILRFLTWMAVIFLVFRPQLVIDRMVEPKTNLAVLIDTSESMALNDQLVDDEYQLQAVRAARGTANEPQGLNSEDRSWAQKTSRIKILEKILNNGKLDLLNRLSEKYTLRLFTFDEKLTEEDLPPDPQTGLRALPEAKGKVTQLGQALRMASAKLQGLPVAGMLLFTDGASNKGEAPEFTAQKMGEKKIPIFPMGLGATNIADIEVQDCNAPDLLFKDDEISVRVTFAATAMNGMEVPVVIKMRNDKGETETLSQEDASYRVTCADDRFSKEFIIKPPKTGDYVLTVEVPQQPNEFFTENNKLEKRVRIIDDAIRILIIVDTPSWEYRYLKGFLNSDKRIKTKVLMRSSDKRRVESDEEFLSSLPKYDDLKKQYDCLIMNNISADYFTNAQMQDIKKYVADDGGALIMISATRGTPGTFISTQLEEMLPVVLRKIPEDPTLDLADTFTKGYDLALTREGRYHVITRLTPITDDNVKLWGQLPKQYWYYTGIERLRPAAVALVEHATAKNQAGRIPLIATQRYGKGQVLFLGFNSIWRWRYKVGNRYSNRFWGQTIQFMGLPHRLGNLKQVQFETQGRDFIAGEEVPLTVTVLDVNYVPVKSDQITLVAQRTDPAADAGDNEREATFDFKVDEGKEGVFSGNLVLRKGSWKIVVRDYEDKENIILDIREPRLELVRPAMQEKTLAAVAKNSGGKVVTFADLWNIIDYLNEYPKPTRVRDEIDLWNVLAALIFVTLTTGAEWVLRRYKDMA